MVPHMAPAKTNIYLLKLHKWREMKGITQFPRVQGQVIFAQRAPR